MKLEKIAVSRIMLIMLLFGMITLAFNVQPAKSDWTWTETIYIRADGSIEPDTAPISTLDNVTYTLTDNIVGNVPQDSSAIAVERDNIVVDGAEHTLQGTGLTQGLPQGIGMMTQGSGVTIKNMEIKTFYEGIRLISLRTAQFPATT